MRLDSFKLRHSLQKITYYFLLLIVGFHFNSYLSFAVTPGPAASINSTSTNSGDKQSATVATRLSKPFAVIVKDAVGISVPNVTVYWSISSGGGTLSSTTSKTGKDGIAKISLTLPKYPSTVTTLASLNSDGSNPVTFSAISNIGPLASVKFISSDGMSALDLNNATVSSSYGIGAVATDSQGNPISGATLTWSVTSTLLLAGTFGEGSNTSVGTSDTNGFSSASYNTAIKPGQNAIRLTATLNGKTAKKDLTFTTSQLPDNATTIVCSPATNNQAGIPGSPLTKAFSVQAKDSYGTLIKNVPITWTISQGAGTLSLDVSNTTGSTSSAQSTFTPSTQSGASYQVRAALQVNPSKTCTFSGKVAPKKATGLALMRSGNSIVVSWNSDTSGVPGLQYSVYRASTKVKIPDPGWKKLNKTAITLSNSYTDSSNLVNGQDYYYYITVTHAGGTTASSPISILSTQNSSPLIDIAGKRMTAGQAHTCVVNTAGQILCWGSNSNGQLGNNSSNDSSTPVSVNDSENTYVAVGGGNFHNCGITSAGKLRCWGNNDNGQLGSGAAGPHQRVPVSVNDESNYTQVSGGYSHSCGITDQGVLKCWGNNNYGQLGDNYSSGSSSASPIEVDSGTLYKSVSTGFWHTCGVTQDGVLKCWGNNSWAQIGTGAGPSETNQAVPLQIGTGFTKVSSSTQFSCALNSVNHLSCWGLNGAGQIGDGTRTSRYSPFGVDSTVNYATFKSGNEHSCALTFSGGLRCWGSNYFGQIGQGTGGDALSPVSIDQENSYYSVVAGVYHSCAMSLDETQIKCWGRNDSGQLGDGSTTPSLSPILVQGF